MTSAISMLVFSGMYPMQCRFCNMYLPNTTFLYIMCVFHNSFSKSNVNGTNYNIQYVFYYISGDVECLALALNVAILLLFLNVYSSDVSTDASTHSSCRSHQP